MRTFIENFEKQTRGRSLYCIWVPAREGEPTPLVARWIDPEGEMHKSEEDHDSNKEELFETWLDLSLQLI